jgi:2-keto-3-deoxy-L-rhamnonate aldolase RhmA
VNPNRILQRWSKGEKALGLAMKAGDPELLEISARIGLDFFSIDGQHAAITPPHAEMLCRIAAGFGITPVIRVPDKEASTLLTYLDRGMQVLIVPLVESKAQAEALVRNGYYAPKGLRSAASLSVVMAGEGADRATIYAGVNENTLIVPQLESRTAHENLDGILSVEGLACFAGGSQDVAQSYGHPGSPDHPEVAASIAHARSQIHAAGKGLWDELVESVRVVDLVRDACADLLRKHGREPRGGRFGKSWLSRSGARRS